MGGGPSKRSEAPETTRQPPMAALLVITRWMVEARQGPPLAVGTPSRCKSTGYPVQAPTGSA
jgi:hypothetical protein